ncbi:helix-turn-helix transcriptional regulator [Rhodococcus erythropolis]|uniref:helix-turn-helix domain-containing protein n=1 Tax=Rhodococcus erythropolis TaxID=1833 RepID=UPI002949A745|nr:helix-turn-helix transcriptional regulator [Rhodococcus erythropolis]MDV6274308.1 helix-turn-helix transcriptional regulator [Rhodococcus erythropolis]
MSSWSDFLRVKMEEKDWDATRLAQAAGYSPSVISRWLSGEHLPSQDKLRATVDALNANIIEAMVAAGFIRPEEVHGPVTLTDPDLLSDEEVVRQVLRRMGVNAARLIAADQPDAIDDDSQERYELARMAGETEYHRRRRLEPQPEDEPQGEAPEWGA